MRIRASGDAQRLAHVSNQALADWYLRRARQTGNADQCTKARAALSGQVSPTPNPPTPNPAAPNPAASNPAAPNSAAPNQAAPNPAAPNPAAPDSAAPIPASLGDATVTRAQGYPGDVLQVPTTTPEQAVTLYGLGWTDTVHAPSPLPEYLALA